MDLKSLLPTYKKQDPAKYKYRFTVFMPVYNRADTMHRVFDSLAMQTFRDFELLVINDGSTDNSHEEILKHTENANFEVRYVNNEKNQHKMACLMQGSQLANGYFFLPFDSDDACTPDALEVFNNTYNMVSKNTKDSVSSVTCLCNDQFGNLVGEKFETDPYYSSTFKNMLKGRYGGEKWGFTKTDILRGVSMNSAIYSNGYVPEGVIWTLLSREQFQTVYINKILRVYYLETENSISFNGFRKEHSIGIVVYALCILNWFHKDYLFKTPILFLKRVYIILFVSKYLEFSKKDYLNAIDNNLLRFIFWCCWPIRNLLKYEP